MAHPRILILGGGFAGLMAAWRLSRSQEPVSTTLLDPRDGSHFLPLLPDVVGRNLKPEFLRYPFREASARWGFDFKQTAALSIDPDACAVETKDGRLDADGMIVATGSQTTFYGRDDLQPHAYTLDSLEDASRLRLDATAKEGATWVVSGGGYTGVELATNLCRLFHKGGHPPPGKLIVVNKGDELCAGVEPSCRRYIQKELACLPIEVRTQTTVESLEGTRVTLSSGESFANAALAWTAGVRPVDAVNAMSLTKGVGGRLAVSSSLQIAPRCYAAGDTCAFPRQGGALRMSIQFAISQGWHAGDNLLRELRGSAPRSYIPRDPGYVVPLAHGFGCGAPLGIKLSGRLPLFLHYFMSLARTWGGIGPRLRLMMDILRG